MSSAEVLNIAVEVNSGKPGAKKLTQELAAYGDAYPDLHFHWEERTGALIGQPGEARSELVRKCDLYLVAGGDGSILESVRHIYPAQIPIFGVNIGSLGFLTALGADELFEALPRLSDGYLRYSERMALQAIIRRGRDHETVCHGLNDVCVSRGDLSRLVRLNVSIGDQLVTQFVADGLLVFTPTGSTAYSLSADGPILSPDARVLGITPICSHSLTHRSIVLGATEPIILDVPEQDHQLVVQIDGKSEGSLEPGDQIEVRPAEHPVVLAYTEDRDFFTILRNKLKWSGTSL
ncbi:MAG: NAD(+)/NADH kinase [Verrucomicrobiota bacterium]